MQPCHVIEIKRPASMIIRLFHDYVGRLPRVRECIPLPRQYHDREWILVVCAAVEGAWPMQVLGSWNKLKEMNVKKIRMVADERVQRKITTTKHIMDRVKSMKHGLMSASIPDEQENVEESEWVSYTQELRLDYYN